MTDGNASVQIQARKFRDHDVIILSLTILTSPLLSQCNDNVSSSQAVPRTGNERGCGGSSRVSAPCLPSLDGFSVLLSFLECSATFLPNMILSINWYCKITCVVYTKPCVFSQACSWMVRQIADRFLQRNSVSLMLPRTDG